LGGGEQLARGAKILIFQGGAVEAAEERDLAEEQHFAPAAASAADRGNPKLKRVQTKLTKKEKQV